MKRIIPLLCALVLIVGMLAVPASAATLWYRYNNVVMPALPAMADIHAYQLISYIPEFGGYVLMCSSSPFVAYGDYPCISTSSSSYYFYAWKNTLTEWVDLEYTFTADNLQYNYIYYYDSTIYWSNVDLYDTDGNLYMVGDSPKIVLSESASSGSSDSSGSSGSGSSSGSTATGAAEPVVDIYPPVSYSYALNTTAPPLVLDVYSPDGGVIGYHWICAIESDYTEVVMLDCGTSATCTPITILPGTYSYFCIVSNTVIIDGTEYTSYTVSPTYYVSVYMEDDSDIEDIKDTLDDIDFSLTYLCNGKDELCESLDTVNDKLDQLLGDDSTEDDDFNAAVGEQDSDFQDDMDILDDMTMPTYDDIDTDFDDILDDDGGNGITLASKFFTVIFDCPLIFQVFFIAFTLALVAYVIFGRR